MANIFIFACMGLNSTREKHSVRPPFKLAPFKLAPIKLALNLNLDA